MAAAMGRLRRIAREIGARAATPAGALIFVALLTAIRLAFAASAAPTEDEAYYRLWALHPAWGFLDHPPMVAWWMAGGMAVFGDTMLGLRAAGVLATAIGSIALLRTAWIILGDRAAASLAVLFFNATILVGVAGIITTPDQPSALFWGLSLWALAELIRSDKGVWWLAIGLFAGLGLVSKYSSLFLGAGIVLWLALYPETRRWFLRWELWAGGVLAVLLFTPVVIWNADHGWASFAKQFGRAEVDGLTARYLPEFIGVEILLVNPLLAPFVVTGALGFLEAARRRDVKRGLIVATSAPFVLYLLLHSLHDRVQGNWPTPLFAASALVAADAATRLATIARPWRTVLEWLRPWIVPVGLVFSVVALAHAVHPIGGFVSRADPTKQLRGWESLADALEAKRIEIGADWIATQDYSLTAQLAFRLRTVPIIQLNERIRYEAAPQPDMALLAKPALYVVPDQAFYRGFIATRFHGIEPLGTMERSAGGVGLQRYLIFKLTEPIGNPLDAPAAWWLYWKGE
ncbi:glycosyltransferase family 39 protein [Segnochrobactrum spirostomi]|nr:glycosyltransferase family 39 protein [Segnochrobactrum spirostomi]